MKKVPEVTQQQNEFEIAKEDDPHRGLIDEVPVVPENNGEIDGVLMDKTEDRATSFFSQPGILAGQFMLLMCCVYFKLF